MIAHGYIHKYKVYFSPQSSPKNVSSKHSFSGNDILLEGYLGDYPESNYIIFPFLFCYHDLLWYLQQGEVRSNENQVKGWFLNPQCSFYGIVPSRLIVPAVAEIITEQLQSNEEEWCNLLKMSKREKVVFLGTDKATLHACYQPGKKTRNLMHLAAESISH